jgi:hypothetical protein
MREQAHTTSALVAMKYNRGRTEHQGTHLRWGSKPLNGYRVHKAYTAPNHTSLTHLYHTRTARAPSQRERLSPHAHRSDPKPNT